MRYFIFIILTLLFFSNFSAEVKVSKNSKNMDHVIHSEKHQRSPFIITYVRLREQIKYCKTKIKHLNDVKQAIIKRQKDYCCKNQYVFKVPASTSFIDELIDFYENEINKRINSLEILLEIVCDKQQFVKLAHLITKFLQTL